MSVSGNFRIDVRPYSGYDDPSLPIASYIAQAGIAGDASGGLVTINFLFQISEGARITELYNLEQMSFDTSTGINRDVMMETLNMDILSPARAGSNQKWQFATEAVLGGNASAIPMKDVAGLPLWLGRPNFDALSDSGGIRFSIQNIDALLYAATIQGYMWGPRSVLASGGPRRPVGGFFR